MPVLHVTLHAYASWMPDREQGSVHWKQGPLPKSDGLSNAYRANQRERSPEFLRNLQRLLIEELLSAAKYQKLEIYAAATDTSHLHFVCAWHDERDALSIRRQVKTSLSRCLNQEAGRRTWFSQGGDLKRVENQKHLSFLRDDYLPDHSGWKWDMDQGWFQ